MSTRETWLNTTQVACMLSVSTNTVRKLVAAGRFDQARDIGTGERSYYQITRESVDKYIKETSTYSTLNT